MGIERCCQRIDIGLKGIIRLLMVQNVEPALKAFGKRTANGFVIFARVFKVKPLLFQFFFPAICQVGCV